MFFGRFYDFASKNLLFQTPLTGGTGPFVPASRILRTSPKSAQTPQSPIHSVSLPLYARLREDFPSESANPILPSWARHGCDRAGARGADAPLVAGGGGAGGRRGGGAPLVFSGARGGGRRRRWRGGVEGRGRRRGGLRGRAHRRAAARGSAVTAPRPYCISPHGC